MLISDVAKIMNNFENQKDLKKNFKKVSCIFAILVEYNKTTRMAVGDATAILFGGLWKGYFRFLK